MAKKRIRRPKAYTQENDYDKAFAHRNRELFLDNIERTKLGRRALLRKHGMTIEELYGIKPS